MPEKKKSSKIAEKRANLEVVGPPGSAPSAPRMGSQAQLASFEAAMKLFHARKLAEARDLFAQAAGGPERDVAQRSRLHIAMCSRRLEQADIVLQSADDYYNYGVALLNARNVAAAREHLETAVKLAPDADHIHYALAVAQALAGDLPAAHESMKRAIELEPRNRVIARRDADLALLADQPPLDALLYPGKEEW